MGPEKGEGSTAAGGSIFWATRAAILAAFARCRLYRTLIFMASQTTNSCVTLSTQDEE